LPPVCGPDRLAHVNDDKLANGRAFVTAEPGGTPDGFRCDVEGNLWCGWGMGNAQQDGVKIFDPTGKLIGFIALPERYANLCFGGARRNRLFMAASHSLYFALREHARRGQRLRAGWYHRRRLIHHRSVPRDSRNTTRTPPGPCANMAAPKLV
jgi:sugar lactone lactonase YvrE